MFEQNQCMGSEIINRYSIPYEEGNEPSFWVRLHCDWSLETNTYNYFDKYIPP
jgi:hypothetical protein